MEKFITLAHGSGGRQTSELIASIFKKHFANELFTPDDAAVLPVAAGRIAMSTDGFVVSPWRFAGGNIGKLSICGTVNDIACMGAIPRYITCAFIIEEGFPVADLEEIASAMANVNAIAALASATAIFTAVIDVPLSIDVFAASITAASSAFCASL